MNFTKVRNPDIKAELEATLHKVCRLYTLGAPVVADDDKIVTSTNMKVGAYTIAAQPDVPRNITVTVTAVTGADTMGTITIVGKDSAGKDISEVITPVADSTVAGVLAFASVASATGAGWVINTGNDTIKIGVGTLIGIPMPEALIETADVLLVILGTAIVAGTVAAGGTVAGSTIDASSSTYNGSKVLLAAIVAD